MHYSCFGLDLDPAILHSFASFEREETSPPLLVFLSLLIFIISPCRVFALFASNLSLLFLPYFPLLLTIFLDFYYHTASSLHLWTLSFAMYMFFRIILLRFVFIVIPSSRPCSSPALKKAHFSLLFLSFLICIMYPHHSRFFENFVVHGAHGSSTIIVIAFFNLCNHLSLWSSLNWPVWFPAWFLILHQIFVFQVILI